MPSWCSPRPCGPISPRMTSNGRCAIITAANAATAPPLAASSTGNNLKIRIVSALVLAPLALAVVWLGWPYLPLLAAAAACGMGWEWARLSDGGRGYSVALMVATPFAAAAFSGLGHIRLAIASALIGGLVIWWLARMRGVKEPFWPGAGTFYLALA